MNGNGRVVEITVVETPEVFRGHFDDCLDHLHRCLRSKFPKGSNGTIGALRPIMDFCKTDRKTVVGWLESSGEKVTGEKKIYLFCFLDAVGYRVFEIRDLGQPRIDLLKIIGYGVMTCKQVAEACGYTNEQSLYRVLLRNLGVGNHANQLMLELRNSKKYELAVKEAEIKSTIKLDFSLTELFLQRNVSSVMSIATGLLSMLETEEFGKVFIKSLANLPETDKRVIFKLSGKLDEYSAMIVRGQ